MADRWFIRPGYTSRESADYFDDIIVDSSGVVHQPDVYPFAFRLAAMWGGAPSSTWAVDAPTSWSRHTLGSI